MPRFKAKNKAKRSLWRRKRTWLSVIMVGVFGLLGSCSGTRILIQTAPSKPKSLEAQPFITSTTRAEWEAAIPDIKTAFESEVYGLFPRGLSLAETLSGAIVGAQFDETALLEFKTFEVLNETEETGREFNLVIVSPADTDGPVPIIMMQNFCPNHNVIPHADIPLPKNSDFDCSGDGVMANIFGYFFGRYITTPPITEIMNRGYALAVMYPSEFIPDSRDTGQAVLDRIFPIQPKETRTAALAAWAAKFSLVTDLLEADPRFSHQISYGHSRYGKSALLAAAFDPNIDGVIAHQSGTGGASLTQDKPGETLTDITEGYPHWFNRAFANFAGREDELRIDQHHLLALIAPRPLMLGNARRDVWSDPEGAFRAARAASKVYGFYGSQGLRQDKLTTFDPEADISYWIRPGTHGVVKEDWPAFLEFLDAKFK